jgi:hypothetical protein
MNYAWWIAQRNRRIERRVTRQLRACAHTEVLINLERPLEPNEIEYTLCLNKESKWEFKVRVPTGETFVYPSQIDYNTPITWKLLATFVPLPLLCGAYCWYDALPTIFGGSDFLGGFSMNVVESIQGDAVTIRMPIFEDHHRQWDIDDWWIKDNQLWHHRSYHWPDGKTTNITIGPSHCAVLSRPVAKPLSIASQGVMLCTLCSLLPKDSSRLLISPIQQVSAAPAVIQTSTRSEIVQIWSARHDFT